MSRRPVGIRLGSLAVAALVVGSWAQALDAQTPDRVRLGTPSWAEVMVPVTRDAAPVTGVAIALPVGSGSDPIGRAGATRVAADAVVFEVERRLGRVAVEGQTRIEPDRTLLTFVVRSEQVGALFDAIDAAGYGSGPSVAAVDSARQRRTEVLRFQLDSPIREVEVEVRALLYGPGDPRNRPPGGTLDEVAALTEGELDAVRRDLFRPGTARVVVVGPVEADRPVSTSRSVSTSPRPDSTADATLPPTAPEPRLTGTTSAGPAWQTGDRRVVEREVTNSWISVAFPVPADLPRIAVLFIADRMAQELSVSPPDPGLFNASVEILELPGGEVIQVSAAVLPEMAAGFESEIVGLPALLSSARDPAFFRFQRGRFRAQRLIGEAAPEAAATRMAAELLTRGEILDFDQSVWTLDAGMAADAAQALGPPRILLFGPDLVGSGKPLRPGP